ncbi:MAG: TlpA family protein disulfide reductase [Zoogloeaceae bacterium]|jgi:peroxiredoxin|nr:TlpA family protein disulfide reductase [Zoogloeaceae bacterium]
MNSHVKIQRNTHRKTRAKIFRALCLAALLAGLIPIASLAPAASAEPGRAAAPAAREAQTETAALAQLLALKLPDAQGEQIDLAQWRGRIRVINLWATWCAPCKAEMPAFSRLQETFRPRGVQFIGIAVDAPEKVKVFAAKTPVSYPLPVSDEAILALSGKLGNPHMGLPFTLVVDPNGNILARKAGRFPEEELARLLQKASRP